MNRGWREMENEGSAAGSLSGFGALQEPSRLGAFQAPHLAFTPDVVCSSPRNDGLSCRAGNSSRLPTLGVANK